MSFTEIRPTPEHSIDDPRVMRIGPAHNRWWRAVILWTLFVTGVAAVLVVLFVRFGATVGWSFLLVAFMLGYMAAMSYWAGGRD